MLTSVLVATVATDISNNFGINTMPYISESYCFSPAIEMQWKLHSTNSKHNKVIAQWLQSLHVPNFVSICLIEFKISLSGLHCKRKFISDLGPRCSFLSAVAHWPLNPLRAKFFRRNINIYFIYIYFMSLLHIDMTQVLKILPQVRPGPI